mgnify:CR=1 FL=1
MMLQDQRAADLLPRMVDADHDRGAGMVVGKRRAALMRGQRGLVHVEAVHAKAALGQIAMHEVLDGEFLAPLRGETDQLLRIGQLFVETVIDRLLDGALQFRIHRLPPP